MKKTTPNNPHDHFFKTAMRDKRVAREFLMRHLPNALSSLVDFENLVPQPGSFINDIRKESTVDVLFKTTMHPHQKEILIYLLGRVDNSSPSPTCRGLSAASSSF